MTRRSDETRGPNDASIGALVELRDAAKRFGALEALIDVSFDVQSGEVHCLLGDNGAGKSTLLKILAGVHAPDVGTLRFAGEPVSFASPAEAARHGIATVHQDLALVPLMSITRNFFLGRERTRGAGPIRWLDLRGSREIAREAMGSLGVAIRDPDQMVGTLSGGERQSLAIARAVHFGAKLLILDEPTAALGVTQTRNVLEAIGRVRDRGLGVVLVTHNVRHAWAVGDRFTVLAHGRNAGTFEKSEITETELNDRMAGNGPRSVSG